MPVVILKSTLTIMLLAVTVPIPLFTACRSTDKATQICEQTNTECQQNCVTSNANFTNTRLPTQPVGPCDQRCEQNYQNCLKRQQNKSIKGINDY